MASKVRAELLALQQASKDRILRAEAVVAWAKKHRQSALYRQFEWSDKKAASEFRLWQARRLIAVNLNIVSLANEANKIVSLSIDRGIGGGYRQISDVLGSEQLSAVMLGDALAELERVKLRYQLVQALRPVWMAVDEVKKAAGGRRKSKTARRLKAA